MAEIKFCGLTAPDDARMAAELGAAFVGVIFAGGPRCLAPDRASEVLDGARGPKRVGVFGRQSPAEIAAIAAIARLDVIQLHGDPGVGDVEAARAATGLEIWAVVRVAGAEMPEGAAELSRAADGLLLDARVEGLLGGTGRTLDWDSLRASSGGGRLILAGGLTPANVCRALAAIRADVVDVSSGVESAPGLKDHSLMRAFAESVRMGAAR